MNSTINFVESFENVTAKCQQFFISSQGHGRFLRSIGFAALLLYLRCGVSRSRPPATPSSEPFQQSNVRGLTLNRDWSHCVAGRWVLFKQNPCLRIKRLRPRFPVTSA